MIQGNVRVEEDIGRTYHCENTETRVQGSNRIVVRMGRNSTCAGRRSHKIDSTNSAKM
jgi:hypothetical protein